MIHLLRILMMTKNIILTLFITFLSYAIVSSIGQPQHSYHSPGIVTVNDKDLP
jgi:hypothetical protein